VLLSSTAVRRIAVVASTALALFSALGSGSGSTVRADRLAPVRVLFIGNSFTRMHDLPRVVRRIAEADGEEATISVARETRPGATLRRHWMRRAVRWRIQSGAYTHVVLQDHSMRAVDRPSELAAYARRFDELISEAGARTVLYAPWARRRHRGETGRALGSDDAIQARIDSVHGDLAGEIDADVAPVGRAWQLASERMPRVGLYGRDGIHPSLEGTYLAACVLYGVLRDRDPRGAAWAPWPMRETTARALREVAADALREGGWRAATALGGSER
jgi:hypothetical protein